MLGGAGPGGEVPPASSQLLTQEQAPSLRTPPGGGRRVPRRITAQRPPPHTHTHTHRPGAEAAEPAAAEGSHTCGQRQGEGRRGAGCSPSGGDAGLVRLQPRRESGGFLRAGRGGAAPPF